MGRCRVFLSVLLGTLLFTLVGSPVSAQQATVVGRVTDAMTGQPVSDAQVSVVGTNQGALTNAEGRYLIRGLPPGALTLRLTGLGYADQTMDVAVVAGENTVVDFALSPVPLGLSGVVVTVT